MNEELEKDYQYAVSETLKDIGVDCDFRDGQKRQAVRGNRDPKTGYVTYRFNEIFPVKESDIFTDIETEIRYEVLEIEAVGSAGLRVIAKAMP